MATELSHLTTSQRLEQARIVATAQDAYLEHSVAAVSLAQAADLVDLVGQSRARNKCNSW